MITVSITLLTTFLIWFGIVKIFTKDDENTINVLSSKLFNDFTSIFRNIITIFDTLYKSFIQIYELIGIFLKNVTGLSDDVRVSERITLPRNRLRGFNSSRIGPVDNKDHVGGNYAAALSLTTNLPFIAPTLQDF